MSISGDNLFEDTGWGKVRGQGEVHTGKESL